MEKVQQSINNSLDKVRAKYGEPDRLILPYDKMEYGYIAFFIQHEIVCISDTKFKFADIASYKLVDNYFIKNGDISGSIKTRTNEGSLIGRALEGSFWGGDTGAIIGAATASKTSSVNISQEDGQLIHDYTLLVNLKGVNREGIEIHIGYDWRLAAELEHLFNQIIESQTQK